jgi:hypothetical protein
VGHYALGTIIAEGIVRRKIKWETNPLHRNPTLVLVAMFEINRHHHPLHPK